MNKEPLRSVRRQEGDILVLDLMGDLVLGNESELRRDLNGTLEAGQHKLLVNLSRIRQVDSTGLGVLVAAKTSAINRNIPMKFCCLPPLVARLLARLQLTRVLEVYEQESAALESFRSEA